MSADALLAACRKVRKTGAESWVACCPAHEDKSPSMTVRETADGMVLLHCFAGCSFESIIGAAGIQADDLFPEKLPAGDPPGKPIKRRYPAADVLLMVEREMQVMAVVAGDLAEGRRLPPHDVERMRVAQKRIEEARRLALG